MKVGKLLTVTALATGITLGAFVDSAEAMRRRTKNTYSRRGTDENDVFSIYSLIDGINDINNTDNNVGFFPGAVEGYISFGVLNNDPSLSSFTTAGLDNGLDASPIFYNPNGLPINFRGCNFGFKYDSSNEKFPLVDENDNDKNVFFEFDDQGDILSLVDEQGNKSSADCFEVEAVNPIQRADFKISRQGANIEYSVIAQDTNEILENFLIEDITLDVNNLSDFLGLSNVGFDPTRGNSIIRLDETTVSTIPESNTTSSIMILGLIGTGLLIKRRI